MYLHHIIVLDLLAIIDKFRIDLYTVKPTKIGRYEMCFVNTILRGNASHICINTIQIFVKKLLSLPVAIGSCFIQDGLCCAQQNIVLICQVVK